MTSLVENDKLADAMRELQRDGLSMKAIAEHFNVSTSTVTSIFHHRGWRKERPSALDRFMLRVKADPETGCWNWTGALKQDGYGYFYVARHQDGAAHRAAYQLLVGPIPDGLQIDHLCRNHACVNPAHLEPVTLLENTRRGARSRTHCRNGHEWTEENARTTIKGTLRDRVCRACNRDGNNRFYRNKTNPQPEPSDHIVLGGTA